MGRSVAGGSAGAAPPVDTPPLRPCHHATGGLRGLPPTAHCAFHNGSIPVRRAAVPTRGDLRSPHAKNTAAAAMTEPLASAGTELNPRARGWLRFLWQKAMTPDDWS